MAVGIQRELNVARRHFQWVISSLGGEGGYAGDRGLVATRRCSYAIAYPVTIHPPTQPIFRTTPTIGCNLAPLVGSCDAIYTSRSKKSS